MNSVPFIQLLVAAVIVGVVVLSITHGDQLDLALSYTEYAAEWCSQRGGELSNSRVIGPHGGLHCELPNGTSVHMSGVVEADSA